MRNICLKLEYNGSGFHGWQIQPGLRTIQSELERVLSMVLGQPIERLTASGRTDAGVHARGQVCSFFTDREVDLQRLMHSVSSIMKPELAVVGAREIDDSFHATRSALRKQYTYTILNRPSPAVLGKGHVWHISRLLDLERMKRDAALLIGEHDFTSFRAARCNAKSPIREIFESEIEQRGDVITYRVVGSGFLKQMVRNIVGTLVGLAKGNLQSSSLSEILEKRDRQSAGVTAPAHGLCLDWVDYGQDLFTQK